jgi:hypothetical protein
VSTAASTRPSAPQGFDAASIAGRVAEGFPWVYGRETARVVGLIDVFAWEYARHPWTRAWAGDILAGERDPRRWPWLVGQWVRDNIVYAPEPRETLELPGYVRQHRIADCDGMTLVCCSLLGSVGFDCSAHAEDVDGDGLADHVKTITPVGGNRFLVVDPTPTGLPVCYLS